MNRSFSVARAVALAGALVALVAFFLPWVAYVQRSFSGADLATTLSPALAAVKGGGIKGLDFGLWAVALAAALAGIFILVSWVRAADPNEGRYRLWAAAAAITGLAFAVLFLASGLLGGTPDINFAPAAIRTDNAVKATIAKAIGAGDFVGIGIGVYLAIAGFAVAAIGAILARPATDERTWRTQDYVLLAVLAVVFGAIYWAWLGPYLGIETILAGVSAQLGQELLFGLWYVSGLLGGYIIRRPGAAFLPGPAGAPRSTSANAASVSERNAAPGRPVRCSSSPASCRRSDLSSRSRRPVTAAGAGARWPSPVRRPESSRCRGTGCASATSPSTPG